MTPQQANELLRAALKKISETRFGWDGDCGVKSIAEEALDATDDCAPAPTEPAVDRDKPSIRDHADFREDIESLSTQKHKPTLKRIRKEIYDTIDRRVANAVAAALATPASTAVPAQRGEFPGVNIDRVHHIMDGYTPKPPPPRPQRPPGPLWTDAERERFRENMKRGERCPICSVIEGGQHFPGCSRGVP